MELSKNYSKLWSGIPDIQPSTPFDGSDCRIRWDGEALGPGYDLNHVEGAGKSIELVFASGPSLNLRLKSGCHCD
jgi:hypothetical protein